MTSRKTLIAALIASTTLLGAGSVMAGKHGHHFDDESGEYSKQCDRRGGGHGGKHGFHKGKMHSDRDLELTAEEAKTLVSARLIQRGNDRLKVGQVKEGDDGTWLVDVVTVDNSLVRTVTLSSKTGHPVRPGMKQDAMKKEREES